jgi:hypothetical protein
MSYDIYLRAEKCPHCGAGGFEPDSHDPTYNLTPIFDFALTGEPLPNPDVGEGAVVLMGAKVDRPRGLRLLNGRKAHETKEWLEKGLAKLTDPELAVTFRALEPPNKWGTLEDAIKVFKYLLCDVAEYPNNTWEIH